VAATLVWVLVAAVVVVELVVVMVGESGAASFEL
jgi:hypothetical protein